MKILLWDRQWSEISPYVKGLSHLCKKNLLVFNLNLFNYKKTNLILFLSSHLKNQKNLFKKEKRKINFQKNFNNKVQNFFTNKQITIKKKSKTKEKNQTKKKKIQKKKYQKKKK